MTLWNIPPSIQATSLSSQRWEFTPLPQVQQTSFDTFVVLNPSLKSPEISLFLWQTALFSLEYKVYKFDPILQPEQNWSRSEARICAVTQYILEHHLGHDPEKISTRSGFLNRSFHIQDRGHELNISGQKILFALAKLRHPELGAVRGLKAMGGCAATIRELKKLLNLFIEDQIWTESEASIVRVTRFILENHLGHDPEKISTRSGFLNRSFHIQDRGHELNISGQKILFALAKLRHPELGAVRGLKAMGGYAAAIRELKKLLGVVSLANISREELQRLITTDDFQDLINYFSNDPILLLEALTSLKSQDLQSLDIGELSREELQRLITTDDLRGLINYFSNDPILLLEVLTSLKSQDSQSLDIEEFVKIYEEMVSGLDI